MFTKLKNSLIVTNALGCLFQAFFSLASTQPNVDKLKKAGKNLKEILSWFFFIPFTAFEIIMKVFCEVTFSKKRKSVCLVCRRWLSFHLLSLYLLWKRGTKYLSLCLMENEISGRVYLIWILVKGLLKFRLVQWVKYVNI